MPARVVIDTNILISLFIGRQHETLIDNIVDEKIQLISSNEQIAEIKSVLTYPKLSKYFTPEMHDELIFLINNLSELVQITNNIFDCRDANDNFILEMAVNGKADFIVSGDQDILILSPYRGIEVFALSEFKNRYLIAT